MGRALMKAALIGAGFMGAVHSRSLRAAGVEIAGVLASTRERSSAAAMELGVGRGYQDLADLLDDATVDVVHILTPNRSHFELVAKSLDAGKHVVCEKPLTVELSEAIALEEMASRFGLVTAIPYVYRYHSMARELRHQVNTKQLGGLLSARGEYLQDWLLDQSISNWRVDSNQGGPSRVFADIGVHLCDLLEFVTGLRITNLLAKMKIAYPERSGRRVDTEDIVSVIAELEGGAMVNLMVSQVAAGYKNGLILEIHGSKLSGRFEQENPNHLWFGSAKTNTIQARDPQLLAPDAARVTRLPAGHPEGYFDAFTSFMLDVKDKIAGGNPLGLPTFADGVRSARIINAVMRSSKSNEWVSVEN